MSDIPVVKVSLTQEQVNSIPKQKKLWDNYLIIGEVRKNNRIKFVFGAGIRDGVRYLNIREFYLRQRDGVWNPGKDGITIPLRVPVEEGTKVIEPYVDFIAMMERTKESLEIMDLSDEENAVYVEMKVRNK